MRLLNRVPTFVGLLVLTVTLGFWRTHSPMPTFPVVPARAAPLTVSAKVAPEPAVAPLPWVIATPTVIEIPAGARVTLAAKPTPKSHPARQPRRRGLFRRR